MKSAEPAESSERRVAILEAATRVFLRYGFKKTSMDDLARAAGLSRQGLYLHFPTKEALFKEALLRLTGDTIERGRAALAKEELPIEARFLQAFEGVHGSLVGQFGSDHMAELMEAASEIVGATEADFARAVVSDVARALKSSGVGTSWKDAGLSAKELAELLYSASHGIKHRVASAAEYSKQMRVAIHVVCSPKHR